MALCAHRRRERRCASLWSGNESLLAFLERPPWSKKYQDSASLTWLSLEARKTLCVREMALRARRRCERRCASVKWYFVPAGGAK